MGSKDTMGVPQEPEPLPPQEYGKDFLMLFLTT